MPGVNRKWEIGSNYADTITAMDTSEIRAKLQDMCGTILTQHMGDGLRSAAEVLRSALQDNTPVGQEEYFYQRHGRTVRVVNKRMGQARANVIVYERRTSGVGPEALSLLIGYEKRHAYYMYWYEYGTKFQAAKPFMRSTFDGAQQDALKAAMEVMQSKSEELGA